MSDSEVTPLVTPSRKDANGDILYRSNDAYLLLSVPPSKRRNCCNNLFGCLGKYSRYIVGISAVIIAIILIVGITHYVDVYGLLGDKKGLQIKGSASRLTRSRDEETRIIETPLGKLRGYLHKSRANRDFISFHKVPYAKAPVNELRFQDPQLVESWRGIRDYSKAAPQCIQKSKYSGKPVGEEDCLYCNIYVPLSSKGDISRLNFPVMVNIHGGGFGLGNGSKYGAEYFSDENVVLITFEYRLGLLGFLNTGDSESTGNMAFKDQVMLLKFVQLYISYFGGDPSRVTIFGNSSGGTSVSFIMISDLAKGLFHRAISESGTALCETKTSTIEMHPERIKVAAGEEFNCSLSSSKEFVNCLRTKTAGELALFEAPGTNYGLTVETHSDFEKAFMSEQPYKLLQSGKINRVPYMIGVMANEMIMSSLVILTSSTAVDAINSNFSQFIPPYFRFDMSEEESQSLKRFYFGDNSVGNHTERNLTNLMSDGTFIHCSKVAAEMFSEHTDTYLFFISKHPKKGYADQMVAKFPFIDNSKIASHADEIQFLFPYYGYPEYPTTDTQYFPFSQFLVKLWSHFGAMGNPVIDASMETWKAVKAGQTPITWFELNDHVGLTTVLQDRMEFLDNFTHKQLTYEL